MALAIALAASVAGAQSGASGPERQDVRVAIEMVAQIAGRGDGPATNDPAALLDALEAAVRRGREGEVLCLFGMAGDDQRAALSRSAHGVIALGVRTIDAIDRRSASGELEGDDADRLLIARETVVPLRVARAAVWLASCTDDEAQREAWGRRAEAVATPVGPLTYWAITERAVLRGLALLQADDADGAVAAFDGAKETLDERPALGQIDGLAFEIEIGSAIAAARSRTPGDGHRMLAKITESPPFVGEGGVRDWDLALLAADIAHRVGVAAISGDDETERQRALERSVVRYAALVGARNASEPDVAVRRRDVYERLRRLVARSRIEPARLPGIAAAAVAAGADLSDPTARAGAFAMLGDTLAGMNVERDRYAPDVLFELGRVCAAGNAENDRYCAAEALLRFAEIAPTDERAGAALAAACAAAGRASDDEADDLYLRCLRAAAAHAGDVANRETWRLELARLLLDGARGDVRERWPAMLEASAALQDVEDPASRTTATDTIASIWLGALDEARRGTLDTEWSARVAAAALAEAGVLANSIKASPGPNAEALRDAVGVIIGEAAILNGRAEAALDATSVVRTEDPVLAARAAIVRFEALVAQGNIAGALGALSRAERFDPPRADAARRRVEGQAWHRIESLTTGFPAESPTDEAILAADILARGIIGREARGISVGTTSRRRAAEALVLVGRGDSAVDIIGATGDSAEWADMLVLLGEAHLLQGDEASAFGAFRRVAVALEPDRAGTRPYWHAWARMLEILGRRNTDSARSKELRREISRLRALESWGAFPDCVDRIERVAGGVGP